MYIVLCISLTSLIDTSKLIPTLQFLISISHQTQVTSMEDFDRRFPAFGGFLPWCRFAGLLCLGRKIYSAGGVVVGCFGKKATT